jgi:hypothetical protein
MEIRSLLGNGTGFLPTMSRQFLGADRLLSHHVQKISGSYSVPIKGVTRAPSIEVGGAETHNAPPSSAKGQQRVQLHGQTRNLAFGLKETCFISLQSKMP